MFFIHSSLLIFLCASFFSSIVFAEKKIVDFNHLPKGTIVDTEFQDLGLVVSAQNLGKGPDHAVIFDSAKPTGGDSDLRQPFNPGRLNQSNTKLKPQKILILQERHNCNTNSCAVPDDEASKPAGTITFTFAEPVKVFSLDFLDIQRSDDYVELKTVTGESILYTIPITGDRKWDRLVFSEELIVELVVHFGGSGALDRLVFETQTSFQASVISKPSLLARAQVEYTYTLQTNLPADEAVNNLYDVQGPQGMSINDNGILTWTPSTTQVGGLCRSEVVNLVASVYHWLKTGYLHELFR